MRAGWNSLDLIDVRRGGVDASSRTAPCPPRLVRRDDDGLIDELAAAGIACVLYFPLSGLSIQQSETLEQVATELADDVTQIAIPAQ